MIISRGIAFAIIKCKTNFMKTKWLFYPLCLLTISLFILSSCDTEKSGNSGTEATLNLFLTDDPAAYDAVYIDLDAIEIHTTEGGWVTHTLDGPGIFNLLDYASGLDTLLLSVKMEPATISQIRLILGSENSVIVDGVVHELETPSAETSGLKLNVHYTLTPGIVYAIWLDFDAEQSIVEQGSGDYSLKPVIRTYTSAESGAISGSISPIDGAYYVMAISGGDTAGTYITSSGTFLIPGLDAGSYDVTFSPEPGFTEITIPDVSVTTGSITDLGVVEIL